MKKSACFILCAVGVICFTILITPAQKKDYLNAKTVWNGQIQQDDETFSAKIFIHQRDGDRIKGEIHFRTQSGLNKLTFQGNILENNTVVWITDKKEGNATFPGLYIGKIEGKIISGTWQVPSANQYDKFSVKLVE